MISSSYLIQLFGPEMNERRQIKKFAHFSYDKIKRQLAFIKFWWAVEGKSEKPCELPLLFASPLKGSVQNYKLRI